MTSRYRQRCCVSQPVSQQYVPAYTPACCPTPANTDPRRFQTYCPPTRSLSEPLSHAEYLRKLKANNTAPISGTLVQYGEGEYKKTIWTESGTTCCPPGQHLPAVPSAQTTLDSRLATESKGALAVAVGGIPKQGDAELLTTQAKGRAIAAQVCSGQTCQ